TSGVPRVVSIEQDKDVLAAEYVLGTLGPDERAEAQALIAVDAGFAETVRGWERRLGELSAMVDPVEPPADMWDRINAGGGVSDPRVRRGEPPMGALKDPARLPPAPAPPPPPPAGPASATPTADPPTPVFPAGARSPPPIPPPQPAGAPQPVSGPFTPANDPGAPAAAAAETAASVTASQKPSTSGAGAANAAEDTPAKLAAVAAEPEAVAAD